jgi:hypothetical protein
VDARRRGAFFDVAPVALALAIKAAIGACVLHAGFTHVSDDDYARVVIAETFAHAPKLDPSGTSWLPFPFWLTGLAMSAFGRTLDVASVVAFIVGAVSVAAPYLAMRAVGCKRFTAWIAVAVAMATPWNAWLGVATVPEAMTACLIAAGAIAVTAPRARVVAALGLLAAALSRYEAWPVCGVFAIACVVDWRAARDRPTPPVPSPKGEGEKGRRVLTIVLAVVGPLAWMTWNAYAHGSPVHFLARVAAYRQTIGAAPASIVVKLTEFPLAVVTAAPAIAGCAAVGAAALAVDAQVRARWAWPLASAIAILAFLVVGDLRDGAPTHHPERAVIPITWILAAFAADALVTLTRRIAPARASQRVLIANAVAIAVIAWCLTLPGRWADHPASSASESRDAQVARGLVLQAQPPSHVTVTPCDYEHFALIAAFGAPERVEIAPATHEPMTPACPRVELH